MSERIQKVLANAGYGSRRKIESLIRQGKITVNGRPAELGQQIDGKARISIESKSIHLHHGKEKKCKAIAYYKPPGEVCTRSDEKGRNTVFERLPRLYHGHWINIGRLDLNTTGLLLFMTDGELANKLMHPSSEIEREYAVRVLGQATKEQLQAMRDGVRLKDGVARFTDIVEVGGKGVNHWYYVVIMAGRNREVRRLWESQRLTVTRLIRTRFGPYIMPRNKRPGQYWYLDKKEIAALKKATLS